MNEYSNNDRETGLDCYDPEGRVFPKIAEKISSGQTLSKQDVLLILKWKLGRLKDGNSQTVTDTNISKINAAVRGARQTSGIIAALDALQNIPGIGLATATVILTVCYPREFTVIDWRVLKELDLFPSCLSDDQQGSKRESEDYNADDWTAETYLNEYLPKVRAFADRWACSLRDADRALWGLSVHRRVQNIIDKSEETMGERTGEDIPIYVKYYDEMNSSEREQFQQLVEAGGEVRIGGLSARIKEAYKLGYAVQGDRLVAVGAVKGPAESYMQKVAGYSRCDLSGYQAELGWIFVKPEVRELHLASRISEALCNSFEGSIFSTTRSDNAPMQAILNKFAFKRMGAEYDSVERPGKKIQLWVLER